MSIRLFACDRISSYPLHASAFSWNQNLLSKQESPARKFDRLFVYKSLDPPRGGHDRNCRTICNPRGRAIVFTLCDWLGSRCDLRPSQNPGTLIVRTLHTCDEWYPREYQAGSSGGTTWTRLDLSGRTTRYYSNIESTRLGGATEWYRVVSSGT
jgi:hypothetical protein